MEKIFVVVVAAGKSMRMKGIDKQFVMLGEKTVLQHTLSVFEEIPSIQGIILVTSGDKVEVMQHITRKWGITKLFAVQSGGNTRQQSVKNGLLAVPSQCDIILIHDGARPLVSKTHIEAVIKETHIFGAATLAVPVKDTIKIANDQGFVAKTLDRSLLWATQTPQGFRYTLLLKAYQQIKDSDVFTDDASLVESLGYRVKLVLGAYENIKITTPEDLHVAKILYQMCD